MDVQITPAPRVPDHEARAETAALSLMDAQVVFIRDGSSRYLRIKRVLDLLFTLLILIPLGIVTAIVALLIRLDSPGPVFYHQKRAGLHGVEFSMLKFRSMYVDCDDSTHREAVARYMSGQSLGENTTTDLLYKLAADPRITGVGRYLRKLSIDELPQFFNVLRGQMTLVGPRPPLPYQSAPEGPCVHAWGRKARRPQAEKHFPLLSSHKRM